MESHFFNVPKVYKANDPVSHLVVNDPQILVRKNPSDYVPTYVNVLPTGKVGNLYVPVNSLPPHSYPSL